MAGEIEPLDLVDIAVLLNYERVKTDPRFSDTELCEIAFPGETPRTISTDLGPRIRSWNNNERTWYVLCKTGMEKHKRPANVVPSTLSAQQLETARYRIRAYDTCLFAARLLNAFFELFPDDTQLLIRHASKDKESGTSYVTSISNRRVIQKELINPKFSTIICTIRPSEKGNVKATGVESQMTHVYTTFFAPGSQEVTSVLDMSSMQFGDAGRGPGEKGKMLVALDTKAEYDKRIGRIADGVDLTQRQVLPSRNTRMFPEMEHIALVVKARWRTATAKSGVRTVERQSPISSAVHAARFGSAVRSIRRWYGLFTRVTVRRIDPISDLRGTPLGSVFVFSKNVVESLQER